jgi:hypothetical protein
MSAARSRAFSIARGWKRAGKGACDEPQIGNVGHLSIFLEAERDVHMLTSIALGEAIMISAIFGFLALLVLLFLFVSVKIVRQGYHYTIEYFGRFTTVARPGFNFYPAFFYQVGRKVNMMEQVLDIPARRSSPRTMR